MSKSLTVGQVNQYIKSLFAKDYALSRLSVSGEVSDCKYHPSGHIYFTLKDSSGILRCVMFASDRGGLTFDLKAGAQVTVHGRVSVYERSGAYQLYARRIERTGAGELYARYEALKKELADKGMFDEIYKRPIPSYAQSIGIVTASSGAAIRDIMNVAQRRNPHIRLILSPVIVQGEEAPASIVRGIRRIEEQDVDLIIVGRGGGSIEDLWAFNDERVAQAIFDCSIPIISAVGHESDTTIADYVADLRAPTPSAAAELAVFDYAVFARRMEQGARRLSTAFQRKLDAMRDELRSRQMRLSFLHPKRQLEEQKKALLLKRERMRNAAAQTLEISKHRLALRAQRMDSLSPLKKIEQGYAYLSDEQGHALRSIEQFEEGSRFKAYVTDGWIEAEVLEKGKEANNVEQ